MSGIMNMFVAAKTTVAAAVDSFFNRVTLLLNTGSTNGAQNNTFLDSSSNGFSITRNGNTTQGTFTPFSQTGWGNYFGGSADYLSIADTATLELGSGNFTIEGWIYLNSLPAASGYYAIVGKWVNTQYSYICNMVNNAGTMQLSFSYTTNGTTSTTVAANAGITANTWHHVAYVRNGSGFKIFLNGTEVTSSATISGTLFDGTAALNIGRNGDASQYFPGYISNLRICKAAVYTANFTPSTTSLTTTSQSASSCVLLTCQDNRFLDNASSLTISTGGTPRVQAFSPFAPTAAYSTTTVGGSGYFDGSGDYLTAPNNTAFDLSTSAFTISFWVYPTTTSSTRRIIQYQNGNSLNSNYSYAVILNNSNQIAFFVYNGTTSYSITSAAIQSNSWNFVTVTRSGSTGNLYVNNVNTSGTLNSTINNPSGALIYIGSDYGSADYMSGYVSDIRVVKGAATAPGANPTSPLTNITNTSLLLNYTNAGIYDAAAKNDLETVGNAQVSTTQAKFGTTSMSFNGTNSYLSFPTQNIMEFGTGDFTIEGWVYFNSVASVQTIITNYSTASLGWGFQWRSDTGLWNFFVGNTQLLTYTNTPSTSTWIHFAVTRSGTSLKMFLNGTQVASTTNSTNISGATRATTLGVLYDFAGSSYVQYLNGYLDEIRITKGYARYTASFTAPTAAFPTQ